MGVNELIAASTVAGAHAICILNLSIFKLVRFTRFESVNTGEYRASDARRSRNDLERFRSIDIKHDIDKPLK